jgi:hypothetical protein
MTYTHSQYRVTRLTLWKTPQIHKFSRNPHAYWV